MEFGSSEKTQDKSNTLRTNDVLPPGHNIGELNMEVAVTADDVLRAGGFGATDDLNSIRPVGTDIEDHIREARAYKDVQEVDKVNTFGEINMEASVTSDEVMRAGGFGATDGISNFLPIASDFTDFEANLRGAREYEDLVEEIHHPGLGWTSESNRNE